MFRTLKTRLSSNKRPQKWDAPSEWFAIEDDTARQHRARTRSHDDMRRWMARTGIM